MLEHSKDSQGSEEKHLRAQEKLLGWTLGWAHGHITRESRCICLWPPSSWLLWLPIHTTQCILQPSGTQISKSLPASDLSLIHLESSQKKTRRKKARVGWEGLTSKSYMVRPWTLWSLYDLVTYSSPWTLELEPLPAPLSVHQGLVFSFLVPCTCPLFSSPCGRVTCFWCAGRCTDTRRDQETRWIPVQLSPTFPPSHR